MSEENNDVKSVIDNMNRCPDFLDFPTAWSIQRAYELEHDDRCSYIQAACFLCDCGAVRKKWEELRKEK